jgi:hypothetical protein
MIFRLALIGLVFVLSACHDSDATSGGTQTQTPPPSAPAMGTARLVINFPLPAPPLSGVAHNKSMKFGPRPVVHSYVSPKTQSVSVGLVSVNGTPPAKPAGVIVNVVAGSDCVVGSGALTCTISIDAPVGSDEFQVTTFAQANGIGGAISMGNTTTNITTGATADASVDLLPVIASVSVSLNPGSLPVTSAGTFTATIIAKDVTGDAIGGSDNYYQALTVNTADAGAHVTASPALPATFASPGTHIITFTYDGNGTAASYSFGIGGAVSQTVNFAFTATVEHLYVVTQFSPAAVFVYDIQPDGSVTGPSRTITGPDTTLNRPTSVAVDSLGNLYVVNYGDFPLQGDNVAVFAPGVDGNVAPIQTLMQGSQPYYVSKGAGAFLVRSTTDDKSATSVVINYTNVTLSSSGLSDLVPPYVEYNASGFSSYLDESLNGYLCVTNSIPEDGGAGYVGCLTTPIQTVSGNIPPGTANIIDGVGYNNITCCGGAPTALAFQENSDLLVAYLGSFNQAASVKTYQLVNNPAVASQIQPIRSISGDKTGLASPTDVAYDSHGNVYVSDTGFASGQGTVHIFAPKADGNVAPIQQIGGLNYPFSIAIGK